MSLDLLWSVLEPKIYFSGILTKILAVWRKSAKPDTGSRFFVFALRHLQIVVELPETISSSKTKSLDLFEMFTPWPPASTVEILPQNDRFLAEKSAKPDTGSRFFVFAPTHLQIVLELPETISSSKTKCFNVFEIFTHWPQVNTVTNLPQIGVSQNPDFRVGAFPWGRYTNGSRYSRYMKSFSYHQTTLET